MPLGHLAINAMFLRPRMGGLETYVKRLIPELLQLRPGLRITVFLSPEGRPVLAEQPWASDVALVDRAPLGRPGTKAMTELTVLGALASRSGADVLHSVAMTGPLRTRPAHVVTLADVTWLVAADPGDKWTVRVWRTVIPPVARAADRLIAISRAGADDIVEHLRVPRERIDVVYPGHGVAATTAPTPEAELRSKLDLGTGPVVLTVSAKRVHKNLVRLVEALPRVRAWHRGAMLVLPGNPTPHEVELKALVRRLGLADAVRFPPYVDAADLEGLYAAASVFVFPSMNEGFGLPIVEAQARGVPVACSNASSLPEAAGPGALLFDPASVDDIAAKIVQLMDDRALADRLVALGTEHAKTFSWERSAAETLESYERALRARERR